MVSPAIFDHEKLSAVSRKIEDDDEHTAGPEMETVAIWAKSDNLIRREKTTPLGYPIRVFPRRLNTQKFM